MCESETGRKGLGRMTLEEHECAAHGASCRTRARPHPRGCLRLAGELQLVATAPAPTAVRTAAGNVYGVPPPPPHRRWMRARKG